MTQTHIVENVDPGDGADQSVPSFGIDVSFYQEEIDWAAVAASGVDFAMIRLGYRGYGASGVIRLDDCFLQNLEGASAAGLGVGVYFFSQAVTVDEAIEEAEFVLGYLEGHNIDYPVVFDWENISEAPARTDSMDTETLCACAKAFCYMVEAAGYTPMIYFSEFVGTQIYDLSQMTDVLFWYAKYSSSPKLPYEVHMWQFSCTGSVEGVSGDVDLNLYFR